MNSHRLLPCSSIGRSRLFRSSPPGATGLFRRLVGILLLGVCAEAVHAQGVLVSGQTTQGAISVAGEVDTWTFSAIAGDTMVVRAGETGVTGGFAPYVRLLSPTGVQLGAGFGALAGEAVFRATNSGTYSVLVSDGSSGGLQTGTYRLTLARSGVVPTTPATDEGGFLGNGFTQGGQISVGDLDVWTVDAGAGQQMILRMGDVGGTNTLAPWIRVYGPNGALLATEFGAVAAEAVLRATNSGLFTVVVADGNSGLGGVGPYILTLALSGDIAITSIDDEGGPLENGLTYFGAIGAGDLDVWNFTANAGETLVVRAGDVGGTNSLTPWVRLYAPSGLLLDSGYGAVAGEAIFRATESGLYMVAVADGNSALGGTGPYILTLARTGVPVGISSGDQGGPMTNGVEHAGEIAFGDIDAWTFDALSGEQLVIRSGDYWGTNSLTPWIRIYGPSGVQVGTSFGAVAAEVAVRATNSGRYLVVMTDGNNGYGGVGPYRLTLARTAVLPVISAGDEGGPLTNGWTHGGSIPPGDLDVWTFSAQAGDYLVLRVGDLGGTPSLAPWIRLFGPGGALLGTEFGQVAADIGVRATNGGVYTVVVADANNGLGGTGAYLLTLGKSAAPLLISTGDEGGPLTNGWVHGSPLASGDLDVWTFTASVGDTVLVRVGDVGGTNSVAPWIRIAGPDGAVLATELGAVAAEAVLRATNSGVFTVFLADGNNGLGGTGPCQLHLIRTPAPLETSPGDQGGWLDGSGGYAGVIHVGDLDAWSFHACLGESITLRMEETVTGSPLVPWIRLYGRDGALLNSNSGAGVAQVSRVAPASGTYTVVVGDGNNGLFGSGGYRLTDGGLYGGLKLCPSRSGTNAIFLGAGGTPHSTYVLLTSTNIATPREFWERIRTNQFGAYGEFALTNAIRFTTPERYFRLVTP